MVMYGAAFSQLLLTIKFWASHTHLTECRPSVSFVYLLVISFVADYSTRDMLKNDPESCMDISTNGILTYCLFHLFVS
jgi:hypothetical protein